VSSLPPPRPPLAKASPWPFVGMAGMACTAFLIGASVLLAPWYAVLGLSLLWVVALVLAVRWFTPHPGRVLWVPVGLTLVWVATVVGGAAAFGWGSAG
jgi:hypothetical protein